jgi:hypothetical protein
MHIGRINRIFEASTINCAIGKPIAASQESMTKKPPSGGIKLLDQDSAVSRPNLEPGDKNIPHPALPRWGREKEGSSTRTRL